MCQLSMLSSDNAWRNGEVYVLFILGLVYFYNTLLLIFAIYHCASIVCGESAPPVDVVKNARHSNAVVGAHRMGVSFGVQLPIRHAGVWC